MHFHRYHKGQSISGAMKPCRLALEERGRPTCMYDGNHGTMPKQ